MEPFLVGGARLAVVTGTSAGIGAALTEALLAGGWTVLGLARRPADFRSEHYTHLQVDLGDVPALADFAATQLAPAITGEPWHQVALVNNAARLGSMRRVSDLAPLDLAALLAVNTVAPVYLMGFMARTVPVAIPLRLVNLSSGAANMGIPGLADYCASKAALRLAGMSLAAEFDQQSRQAAVFSYEPGVVATDMQVAARAADPAEFPSQQTFMDFAADNLLASPPDVVGEIVDFMAGSGGPTFVERRFQGR